MGKAQFGICVDSSRINAFFPCGASFDPVCGCDGETYSNECISYNRGGVNTIEYSGVCDHQVFHFDFWPNPNNGQFQFFAQLAASKDLDLQMQIIDAYGHIQYSKLLNNLSAEFPYIESLFLPELQPGVYFLVIRGGGQARIKKFVSFNR